MSLPPHTTSTSIFTHPHQSHSPSSLQPPPLPPMPFPLLVPHLSSVSTRGGLGADVQPHPAALSQPSHPPHHAVGPAAPAPVSGLEAQPVRRPAAAAGTSVLLHLLPPSANKPFPGRTLAQSQETAGHPRRCRQRQVPLSHTHHPRPASAGDEAPITVPVETNEPLFRFLSLSTSVATHLFYIFFFLGFRLLLCCWLLLFFLCVPLGLACLCSSLSQIYVEGALCRTDRAWVQMCPCHVISRVCLCLTVACLMGNVES